MQLGGSNSTDIETLKGLTRFYANTLNNTGDFTDAMIVALLNQAYRRVELMLLKLTFNFWEKDTTDGAGSGAIDLVAGTQAYTLITDILTVERVEINYSGDSNDWVRAEAIVLDSIRNSAVANASSDTAIKGTVSRPVYWIRDNKIHLDPVPSDAVTGGLKVWASTQIADLVNTTDEPIILEAYQPILCRYAASQYASVREKGKLAQDNFDQARLLEEEMIGMYFRRSKDRYQNIKIKPKKRNYA